MLLLGSSLLLFAAAEDPVYTFQLPNGLRVIHIPNNEIDSVCVMLYVMSGVSTDPADIRGASYLFQQLMYAPTENLEEFEYRQHINKNGGITAVRVNYDNSVLYDVLPASELNIALWLQSERLKSLKLGDRELDNCKNQFFNRMSRTLDNNVLMRAMNQMHAKVFEGTVYEQPLYGDLNRLRQIPNDRIRETYQRFRTLADVFLVIAGKYDANELRNSVNKYFQDLPGGEKSRLRPIRSVETKSSFVNLNWMHANIPMHTSILAVRGPSRLSGEYNLLDFLRCYLSDPRLSRLQTIMNRNNRLDIAVSGFMTENIGNNAMVIQLAGASRGNLEKAKVLLGQELLSLQSRLLGEGELKETAALMELDFLKSLASPEGRALKAAEFFHLFSDLHYSKQYVQRIRRINAYEIQRAAQKYFVKDNRVMLNVLTDNPGK